MDVIVTLIDQDSGFKEIIKEKNVDSKKHFSYYDTYGAKNDVRVFNDGIAIYRKDKDHQTYVVLREKSYIKVKSLEGCINFSIKALAICLNNDIISIDYCVNDSIKQIKIEYIGEQYSK